MNDLILIPTTQNALEIFKTEAVDDILKKIRDEVKKHELDISTAAGRKEIASLAHKVAKTKTALDDMGKDLVDEWKQKSKVVDIERKRIRDDLDALKEEVRRPLTEWEDAEKLRVDTLQVRLENLAAMTNFMHGQGADVETIERHINQANELLNHNWQEFSERANREYARVSEALTKQLNDRKKYDADQAELVRLRAEQEARDKAEAERKEAERIEKLKQEAAENARLEAEAKAKREQDERDRIAKAEQERVQREKDEAEAALKKSEQDRIDAENRAKAAAQKAEADRLAAEQKAKDEAAKAEEKRLADIENARKNEEARQQKIRDDEAAEIKRREEDLEHRRGINKDAVVALSVSVPDLEMGYCQKVIEAIAKGKIPNVKITY